MKIVIINYGAGNIQSIKFAIQRLGFEAVLSHDEDEIRNADKVIFPGVGEASSAMEMLKSTGLDKVIPTLKQPVLGICLGMQLLSSASEESKDVKGLSWIKGKVIKIDNTNKSIKIPHMGWNNVKISNNSRLYMNVDNDSSFYFVHSFHFVPEDETIISGICEHGTKLVASIEKDNIFGTQFHPEKSHDIGTELLKNFLQI